MSVVCPSRFAEGRTTYVFSMSSLTGCEGIPAIAAGAIVMLANKRVFGGRDRAERCWFGKDGGRSTTVDNVLRIGEGG